MIELLGEFIEQNIVGIGLACLSTGVIIWTAADIRHHRQQKSQAMFDEANRALDEEDLGV